MFATNVLSGVKSLPIVTEVLRMNEKQPGREWGSVSAEGELGRNTELLERKEVVKERGCRDASVNCRIGVKGAWDFFVVLVQLF